MGSALDQYLSIAKEAVMTAGKYLSEYERADISVDSSHGKDVKLSADRESEDIIVEILKSKSDFPILSEESGSTNENANSSSLRWIVDPLDGSVNFFRDIPNCCVSIALSEKEIPVLGVIYDFNRDDLFTGFAEGGAWLNDSAISVSSVDAAEKAVLFTGFPVNTDFSSNAIHNYVEQVRVFKKVRLIGSAALSLAYVAAGRADAYFEKDIMLWDIAAGLAIVAGAGGRYTIETTEKSNAYNAYVTNGLVHNILQR